MAICGAMSSQGNHRDWNRTRFSIVAQFRQAKKLKSRDPRALLSRHTLGRKRPRTGLLVGFFEPFQLLVATFDRGVQRFFGAFFTGPDLLEFFVVDGADLHKVAQTDAA